MDGVTVGIGTDTVGQWTGTVAQLEARGAMIMRDSQTKTFDTSTLQGLKQAERFQARMYDLYESVNVYAIGWSRVKIVALRPIGIAK
jgi:hypothetical protein